MKIKRKRRRRRRYHTGIYVSKKTGQYCRYRSGWELSFMKFLDSDQSVVGFLYEGLLIPYVPNKRVSRVRNYKPDFLVEYVDGRKIVIEIKPSNKVNTSVNKKKFDAARSWCAEVGYEFIVLTECELKTIGVL